MLILMNKLENKLVRLTKCQNFKISYGRMFVRWEKLSKLSKNIKSFTHGRKSFDLSWNKLQNSCKTNEFIICVFDFVSFMFLFRDFRIRKSHKIALQCEFIETGVCVIQTILFFAKVKIQKWKSSCFQNRGGGVIERQNVHVFLKKQILIILLIF